MNSIFTLITLAFAFLFTASLSSAIDSPLHIGSKSQLLADRTWTKSS